MTFMEVMVAAAIMFTAAVVMITVLPKLVESSVKRTSRDMSYLYAMSKMDEMMASSYSSIAASGSGNYSTLMPDAPDASMYSWSYTSTELSGQSADYLPTDLLKSVTLVVKWGTDESGADTFVFLVADKSDD